MSEIRAATWEDKELVSQLVSNFLVNTNYYTWADSLKLEMIIEQFLSSPDRIVLLYGDYGFLAGAIEPFIFGHDLIATELAWWVEPSERGRKAGKELLETFEHWANTQGCRAV